MSGPSLLADALRLAGTGRGVDAIAGELGVPVDLVATVLDHAERLGLAERVCASCSPAPGGRLPLACAGCPLVRR